MKRIIPSWIATFSREPILHFMLIGAAIFGLYAASNNTAIPEAENRITVTAGDIEQLYTLWLNRWRRAPTPQEMNDLVEAHVREEVMYREALALGLDQSDPVVRRRLAQKYEFLTEDLVSRDPTEAELLEYFEANKERYRAPPRLSFTQVFFSPDRRGAFAERDADMALTSLRAGPADVAAAGFGDRALLDESYRNRTTRDVEAVFGHDFTTAVSGLEIGVWSGPIASGYGLHVVRLDERTAGRVPEFMEVEERVRADWSHGQRRAANEAIFQRSLARYEIIIEGAGAEP